MMNEDDDNNDNDIDVTNELEGRSLEEFLGCLSQEEPWLRSFAKKTLELM